MSNWNGIGGLVGDRVTYVIRNCERDGHCPCLQRTAAKRDHILKSEYNCVQKNYGLKGIVKFINVLTEEQKAALIGQDRHK